MQAYAMSCKCICCFLFAPGDAIVGRFEITSKTDHFTDLLGPKAMTIKGFKTTAEGCKRTRERCKKSIRRHTGAPSTLFYRLKTFIRRRLIEIASHLE